MLAQFQSLYPKGSLISELVQIFQGKYIVRASVQIEGVTRATGMAAAETVEAAEDQARTRALIVLGITNAPPESVVLTSNPVSPAQLNPSLNTKGGLSEPAAYSSAKNENFVSSQWPAVSDKEISIPPSKERNIKPEVVISSNEQYGYSNAAPLNDTYSQDLGQNFPMTAKQELEFDPPVENLEINFDNQPENQTFPAISANNVTPFTPRSYSPQENAATPSVTGKRKKKAEPVDLSDVIAKTDVHIERLGWSKEQGKDHLKKTYNKLGRTLLTEDELLDFLNYLESQPSPLDPEAGF